MYPLIFALALQSFFPLFSSNPGEFTGLSVVNPDNQARDYTISVTSEDGDLPQTGRVTVPANGQRAFLLNEIVTNPAKTGWIRIDTEASTARFFLTSGNAESFDGTDGAISPATSILLPYIEVNTGFVELSHTDTLVAIVNPNMDSALTTLQLVGLGGQPIGETTVSVPPKGSRTLRVSETYQSVLPANGLGGRTFKGYLRLNATAPIAAWQRVETPVSRSALRGSPLEEMPSTAEAVMPHFVFGGTYGSVVNLVNPASTPITLDLTAFDDRGNAIGSPIQLTLAAGEARRASVGELFRVIVIQIFPPPVISGYIRIRKAQGGSFEVVGNVEIFSVSSSGKQSSLLSPLLGSASTNWLIPFSTGANSFYTGYSIVNANELLAVQTDVTVEIVGSDGTLLNRATTSLSPRNRLTGILLQGVPSGYIRIRSNFPVYAMGSVGRSDERQMDIVPALQ